MNVQILLLYLLKTLIPTLSEISDQDLVNDLAFHNLKFTADLVNISDYRGHVQNFVFSPLSAQLVMSLLSEGALGRSYIELISGGYIPEERRAFSVFLGRIHDMKGKLIYNSANRIFLRPDIYLNKDFDYLAKLSYKTTVQKVNFLNPKEAATAIDEWVSLQNFKPEQHVVNPNLMNPHTNIIMVNTVFLNVTWQTPFHLKTGTFNDEGGNRVTVPVLKRTDTYGYYEHPILDAKFLEVPIVGTSCIIVEPASHLSMVFILPNKQDGINELAKNIVQVFAPQPLQQELVTVAIPKFKIETVLNLTDALSNLAIKQIFSKKEADLTYLALNIYQRYYITAIMQHAVISIDRYGAKADTSSFVEVPTRYNKLLFNADHPFFYYIQKDGVILFAGSVASLS